MRDLDFDHVWTLDPVFEAGPLDLVLLRNGEPFASERLQIEPGRVSEWAIEVTE